jgi:ubiquinone biosynthesis monooxygenase Coq7
MDHNVSPACTQVFYDGSCPLCTREIQLYQDATPLQPFAWVDVSLDQAPLPDGVTRDQLMRRFHVLTAEGQLLDGARAFVGVWRLLPGWRHLARLASWPGVLALMELGYTLFLRVRPSIQRGFVRWQSRSPRSKT